MRKVLQSFLLIMIFHMGSVLSWEEQITTVAVIDIVKIYVAFPRESSGYNDLNRRKRQYQKEIDDQVAKLDTYKKQRLQALSDNNVTQADRLDKQISKLADYIDSLSKRRQSELITLSQVRLSKAFLDKLQKAIKFVAEDKGYTIVMRSNMEGMQWWAAVVDITQDVIKRLRAN